MQVSSFCLDIFKTYLKKGVANTMKYTFHYAAASLLAAPPGTLVHTSPYCRIVVRCSEGDSMGATENAGFDAKVQWNLGLDFVTKQHKSLQKLESSYSLA